MATLTALTNVRAARRARVDAIAAAHGTEFARRLAAKINGMRDREYSENVARINAPTVKRENPAIEVTREVEAARGVSLA